MEVHIAFEQWEYEPSSILGCFSTLEKAQKVCDEAKAEAFKEAPDDIKGDRIAFFVKSFILDIETGGNWWKRA